MRKIKTNLILLFVLLGVNIADAATPTGHWPLDVRDTPSADKTPDTVDSRHADLYPAGGNTPIFTSSAAPAAPTSTGAMWPYNIGATWASGNVQYAKVTDTGGGLTIGSSNATIALWVNFSALTMNSNEFVIIEKFSGDSGPGWTIYSSKVNNNTRRVVFYSSADGSREWTTSFTANQWYHLAMVRNATAQTMELYKNGVSLGTRSYSNGNLGDTNLDLWIGARNSGDGRALFMDGGMDEVYLYHEVLNKADIDALIAADPIYPTFSQAIVFSGDDYRDAAVVDYDDDGYVDIIIQRKVYRNNGNGSFTYKTTIPASPLESGGSSGDYTVWADFDGDGTRDVLVAGGVGTSMFVSPLRDRIHKVSLSGDGTPTLSSYHDIKGYDVDWVSTSSLYPSGTEVFGYNQNNTWGVALADVDKDGKVDMYLGRGRIGDGGYESYGKDWLVKNNLTPTNWNYYEGTNGANSATVDLTNSVGMTASAQRFGCSPNYFSHAEGASATDYNFDGNPDFFIPSYRMFTNYLWRGAFNGSSYYIDNAADQCGVQSSTDVDLDNYSAQGHGTGIHWYDYDNDGDLDFVQVRLSHWFAAPPPSSVSELAIRLWANDGDGTFTKKGTVFSPMFPQISLTYSNHYRGVGVGDYDNDGDMDVYVTYSVQPGEPLDEYTVGRLYNYNSIADTYTDVAIDENLANESHQGNHGAAFIDYNNDGKLDLFTTRSYHTGSPQNFPEIWRNDGNWSGNYLFVRLFPPATYNGKPINSDAINAMVQIWIDKNGNDTRDAGETLTRQQLGYNTGHMWVGPQPIHFGLGNYDENHIKWIRVLWPGIDQNVGGWEYFDVYSVNRTMLLGSYTCDDLIAMGFKLRSDFNNDCSVDVLDLMMFAENWLQCHPAMPQPCP